MNSILPKGVKVPGLGTVSLGQRIEDFVPKGTTPTERTVNEHGSFDVYKVGDRRVLEVATAKEYTSIVYMFGEKSWHPISDFFDRLFGTANAYAAATAGPDGVIKSVELGLPGGKSENTNGRMVEYDILIKPGKVTTERSDGPSDFLTGADVRPDRTTFTQIDLTHERGVDKTEGTALPKSTITPDWLVY